MVTDILTSAVSPTPTYLKVANAPGLYRHARSGRYYACKKLGGVRRERSLGTCDRKIAERRLREWTDNLGRVDAEVEKTRDNPPAADAAGRSPPPPGSPGAGRGG